LKGRALALLALFGGSLGCSNLPTIESGECGNRVLEGKEDCDHFPHYSGSKCLPPGDNGCHYSCAVGQDGQGPRCPPHMGCDRDGICRNPSGEFDPPQELSADVSTWLSSADFDGDLRPELVSTEPEDQLGRGRFRLHYFDHDANITESRTFPRFTTRPIVRDVRGDGFADLIFSNGRIGVIPGRRDRAWVPEAFSSYVVEASRVRVVGVREGNVVAGGIPVVALATIEGASGLFVPNIASLMLEPRVRLDKTVDDLAGGLLTADVVTGPGSPCAEVVLAFRDEARLFVFDVCEPFVNAGLDDVNWRAEPRLQLVPLSVPVHEGPLSGDVDGDGHLDVVFGSGGQAYVVYGDGAGLVGDAEVLQPRLIGSPPQPGAPPMEEPGEPTSEPEAPFPMPIALGDFSGDGVADFVLPQQLLVSRRVADGSGVGYQGGGSTSAEAWTMAEIADLNGNGFPDVVAASAGANGYMFFNGTGSPYLVEARVATARPLLFLNTGDFDGDLLGDLALIESGAMSQAKDTLSIAYGARDALPGTPVRVTEVEGAEQLGDCENGGMDALFVSTARYARGLEGTFTLFDGSPDRLPIATYSLVTFLHDGGIQDNVAASLTAGQFSRPGVIDVVALGVDYRRPQAPWSQWLLPDIGGLVNPPERLDMVELTEVVPLTAQGPQASLSVASASADLDESTADGLEEVLWLIPTQGAGCALLIYGIDARAGRAVDRQVLELPTACPEPELAVADLNDDGAKDVLLLLGNIAADHASRLEVLWNDRRGTFSLSDRTTLINEAEPMRAFTVLPERPEVLIVTDGALDLYRLQPETRRFGDPEPLAALRGGRAVTVTDPNGDNQHDIVAADGDGLWLLRAGLEALE
jgi:hypothetical protein